MSGMEEKYNVSGALRTGSSCFAHTVLNHLNYPWGGCYLGGLVLWQSDLVFVLLGMYVQNLLAVIFDL